MAHPNALQPNVARDAEPHVALIQEVSLRQKLRNLGRASLAMAGVSLALLGTDCAEASHAAAAGAPLPITQTVDSNMAVPLTGNPQPIASPETNRSLKVGVATDGQDGIKPPALFKVMAGEGFNEVRLNLAALPVLRPLIAGALANNLNPIISLPLSLTPQQAAQTTALLPSVKEFVIGNEVNSPLFSDMTPEAYVQYLAQVSRAIRQIRPDATLWGFGEASGYNALGYFEEANAFANQQLGGLFKMIDGVDIHLYRTVTKDLQMIQAYERDTSLPLRIGEWGFPVNDADNPTADSLAEQANDEVTFLTAIAQDPQIEEADMFRCAANPSDPFDTANIAADGIKRPAFYAEQTFLTGQ